MNGECEGCYRAVDDVGPLQPTPVGPDETLVLCGQCREAAIAMVTAEWVYAGGPARLHSLLSALAYIVRANTGPTH